MTIFKRLWFFIFFFLSIILIAQPTFDNPLHHSPLFLAGSFAELRINHFHSGIDIKTNGVIGKPVYAVEDGYISRVSVSPWGFGKVLYITHTNGYTSIYAHLSRFRDDINTYIQNKQYHLKKNEVNLYLPKNKFIVKRGQQIAWSGNSGSSGGPHLHFELRKTTTEHPINPLQFKFPITDNLPPKILSLMVIDTKGKHIYPLQLKNKKTGKFFYTLEKTLLVSSPVRFAIEGYDYLNGSSNQCGLNSLTLFFDEDPIFGFLLNELSYNEMRYINSLIDYSTYTKTGKRYQRLFRQPGNFAHIYSINKNDGEILLSDSLPHHIKIVAKDSYGNTSVLLFTIRKKELTTSKKKKTEKKYSYYQSHKLEQAHFSIAFPKNSFYDNVFIEQKEIKTTSSQYVSPIYQIGNDTIPLHKSASLKIQIPNIKETLKNKLCLVRITDYGNKLKEKTVYTKGHISDNFYIAKIKNLGYFTFLIDTVAPVIMPIYLRPHNNIFGQAEIKFKVYDNLSGLLHYDLYLDNQWHPVFFDAKKKQMICTLNKNIKKGWHTLRFKVVDNKKNKQVYNAKFLY
jgi:hypothetical protein